MTKRKFWGSFLVLWIAAFTWSGMLVYDAKQRAESAKREAEMVKAQSPYTGKYYGVCPPGATCSTARAVEGHPPVFTIVMGQVDPLPLECPDYKVCI